MKCGHVARVSVWHSRQRSDTVDDLSSANVLCARNILHWRGSLAPTLREQRPLAAVASRSIGKLRTGCTDVALRTTGRLVDLTGLAGLAGLDDMVITATHQSAATAIGIAVSGNQARLAHRTIGEALVVVCWISGLGFRPFEWLLLLLGFNKTV